MDIAQSFPRTMLASQRSSLTKTAPHSGFRGSIQLPDLCDHFLCPHNSLFLPTSYTHNDKAAPSHTHPNPAADPACHYLIKVTVSHFAYRQFQSTYALFHKAVPVGPLPQRKVKDMTERGRAITNICKSNWAPKKGKKKPLPVSLALRIPHSHGL